VIKDVMIKSLNDVLKSDEVPAVNPIQCGNYRLHSLDKAKSYAKDVLSKGFNDNFIIME